MGLKTADFHSPHDLRDFVNTALKVTAAVVNLGNEGLDYEVDDLLTVGGAYSQAVLKVVSVDLDGKITGVSIHNEGAYLSVPVNPVSVSGGSGAGAKFDLTTGLSVAGQADIVRIIQKDARWFLEYWT